MTPFRRVSGLAAPMPVANIDTDQLAPKQFLTTTERTGLAKALFHDQRFDADGTPKPGFVLDTPPFDTATILIAGNNFGCGSSREHAVWALCDFGFCAVIAPSFADIFYNNAVNNGLLAVSLDAAVVELLLAGAAAQHEVAIDLEAQVVEMLGNQYGFVIDPAIRARLLSGMDMIDEALARLPAVRDREQALGQAMPWLGSVRTGA